MFFRLGKFQIALSFCLSFLCVAAFSKSSILDQLSELATYDYNLNVSSHDGAIFLKYHDAGHQLMIENNRLTAIVPLNSNQQRNGYQIHLKWNRDENKGPEMTIDYYSKDSLIKEKAIVHRKYKKKEFPLQNVEYKSFNEYEFNDSLNNSYERRFLIAWTYNTIRIIGSGTGEVIFLQFDNGWIRSIGIINSGNRKLNHICYFYDKGTPLFKLNFVNGLLDDKQSYYLKNIEYEFFYEAGEFVDCEEPLKASKLFERYFSDIQMILHEIDLIPTGIATYH